MTTSIATKAAKKSSQEQAESGLHELDEDRSPSGPHADILALQRADGGVMSMAHLFHATQREYQKLGKVLSAAELYGTYREVAL